MSEMNEFWNSFRRTDLHLLLKRKQLKSWRNHRLGRDYIWLRLLQMPRRRTTHHVWVQPPQWIRGWQPVGKPNGIPLLLYFLSIFPGENNPAARKQPGKLPRTDSECQFQAPGVHFLKARNTNLTEQVLVFKPSKPIRKELKNKCDFFPRYVHPSPFKDQTTQTLYR